MNLLLLLPEDRLDHQQWRVDGRRHQHLRNILKLVPGDSLRAGVLDGQIGTATLLEQDRDPQGFSILTFQPERQPPAPLPLKLVLALPRPKMLKRVLSDCASLGVKHITLLNSYKVDKSYWQTPHLKKDLLEQKLHLGLEQAMDTRMPVLTLEPAFKPFVEDRLPALAEQSEKLVAHPTAEHASLPSALEHPVSLAIGPEGGWTDYEFRRLQEAGFKPIRFGTRILRVETAVPALIGRLLQLP